MVQIAMIRSCMPRGLLTRSNHDEQVTRLLPILNQDSILIEDGQEDAILPMHDGHQE